MRVFKKLISNNITTASLSVAIAVTILLVYINYIDRVEDTNYRNLVNALVPAVILGFIFTALSKLKIIINVDDISKEAQKNLGDLGDLINGNTNHGLSGTEDRFNGFSEMEELGKGDKVQLMDTRISSSNLITDLEKILEKGVALRLIVMHPESELAKYRFLDITSITDSEEYLESLKAQKKQLDSLVAEKNFDIMVTYTKEYISCPIFIVHSGNHEFAYTGYYLHNKAREFPHVFWKSRKAGLIDQLEVYFQGKWDRASGDKTIDELVSEKDKAFQQKQAIAEKAKK